MDYRRPGSRGLDAARAAGASAITVVGQFAVDSPELYFGPADQVTKIGLAVALGSVAVAVLVIAGLVARRAYPSWLAPLLYSAHAGAFLAPLVDDPVVAGAVVLWNLLLLTRFTLLDSHTAPAPGAAGDDEIPFFREGRDLAARHLLGVSLLATLAVVGYGVARNPLAYGVCALLAIAGLALASPLVLHRLRSFAPDAILVTLAAIAAIATALSPALALSLAALAQTVALLQLLVRTTVASDLLAHFLERPAQLVLVSFGVLIAFGTMLLSLPAASATGSPIAPVDALFTSTSAACVTGLIVLDTPRDFSTFGHAVILGLIQAGGLNIMVLSTFGVLILGRGRGVRAEAALGEVLDLPMARSALRISLFVVGSTFAIELAGAALLAWRHAAAGIEAGRAIWYGVFHAISAFCNAGFALYSDSLIGYQGDFVAIVTISLLIIAGGLGFPVLAALWYRALGRETRAFSLQVRLVLRVTLVLVVAGTVLFAATEWNASLAGLSWGDKWLNAYFQSVTTRTAGFNSVDITAIQPATVLIVMALMFIGASPGGTGGGLKTTTVAVLLGAVPTIARGRPRVVFFGRRVPLETVFRCAAIAVVGVLIVAGGSALALATQQGRFEALVFEVFSAFGTVGLSLGATAQLNDGGKLLIAAIMFLGRVGPLTLALLLARTTASRIQFPEAKIMVG